MQVRYDCSSYDMQGYLASYHQRSLCINGWLTHNESIRSKRRSGLMYTLEETFANSLENPYERISFLNNMR